MSCTNQSLRGTVTVTLTGVPTITSATVSGNSVCITYTDNALNELLAIDTAGVYAVDTAAVYGRAQIA